MPCRPGDTDPFHDLSLDLAAIAGTRIELPHQSRGPGAQTSAHLGEVLLGHLPHRAIELELLDRSKHELFSRSSAARVRPPSIRAPSLHDFCVKGRNVRSAAMPTAAAAKIVRLIMITAAGDSPRAMNTAIVAPIRPASVKSCQGSNVGCGSVEVSELIVQAGIERRIDGHVGAARTGCGRTRRPASRGEDDDEKTETGERIRQHPGQRIEARVPRYREHRRAVLLDERRRGSPRGSSLR